MNKKLTKFKPTIRKAFCKETGEHYLEIKIREKFFPIEFDGEIYYYRYTQKGKIYYYVFIMDLPNKFLSGLIVSPNGNDNYTIYDLNSKLYNQLKDDPPKKIANWLLKNW